MAGPAGGRLLGKVAIITGAARGMGESHTRRFVAEGAQVVMTDVLRAEGEAVAGELGDAVVFVEHDVTSEAGWDEVVATTLERFGRLDVLVNNAGILRYHPVHATPPDEFRLVLEVNLVGPFLGTRAVAEPMTEAGGGSIVNISSVSGIMGTPITAAYVSSKWGVTGLTKASAIDLGKRGIRVNSVHPGGVNTPMTGEGVPDEAFEPFYKRLPISRLGTPEDVSNLVLFLASDDSSYCTGAEFVVDGGQSSGDLSIFAS